MNNIEEIVNDNIIALIPVYVDMKGNSTKIITRKSPDIYIYKTLRTVLKIFAKYFTIDLNASRKYYGELINTTNVVPIPFNNDNILIPTKFRKPIAKNDGSFGYINLNYVENIEERKDGIYILFKGGKEIKSIQNYKVVKKHINDGKLVKKIYSDKQGNIDVQAYDNFYAEYQKPATRGDIVMLKKEILLIRKTILSY